HETRTTAFPEASLSAILRTGRRHYCQARSGHMRGQALLRHAIAIGVVLCAMAPPGAAAQVWPTRPVTIVVPFAAGGAADGTARVLAGGVSQGPRPNLSIENITRAGSTLGARPVGKGAGHGST